MAEMQGNEAIARLAGVLHAALVDHCRDADRRARLLDSLERGGTLADAHPEVEKLFGRMGLACLAHRAGVETGS